MPSVATEPAGRASAPGWRAAWRTTPFRLAVGFGLAFVLGVTLLLGLVYVRTAGFLTRRVDLILAAEAATLARAGPERLPGMVAAESRRDPLNALALYAQSGDRVAGETGLSPADLPQDGGVREVAIRGRPVTYRARAVRLPWGETLVVGRDTGQLAELRRVLLQALIGGGVAVAAAGVAAGFALSLDPLRRVRAIQAVSGRIVGGDLSARLPVGARGDELDALAAIVNAMLVEVERLMVHARTAGESVAHELRTPLTRLRATLEHAAGEFGPDDPRRPMLERCVAETDGVLARFRALLRIAAVDSKRRQAAFAPVDLAALLEQVGELYQPLAEAQGLRFRTGLASRARVRADPDLLFEAVANLVDNAIKFTAPGGEVTLRLVGSPDSETIEVADTGPGIAEADLPLVTRRFYRGASGSAAPGHGLGLSLVTAVADLHGFELRFATGPDGTRVSLGAPASARLRRERVPPEPLDS